MRLVAGPVRWERGLGGTCIPRNMLEDQEERLAGLLRAEVPLATHFLMCFSRVLATLNGISQNLHL